MDTDQSLKRYFAAKYDMWIRVADGIHIIVKGHRAICLIGSDVKNIQKCIQYRGLKVNILAFANLPNNWLDMEEELYNFFLKPAHNNKHAATTIVKNTVLQDKFEGYLAQNKSHWEWCKCAGGVYLLFTEGKCLVIMLSAAPIPLKFNHLQYNIDTFGILRLTDDLLQAKVEIDNFFNKT